jgi:hypothetical protein
MAGRQSQRPRTLGAATVAMPIGAPSLQEQIGDLDRCLVLAALM